MAVVGAGIAGLTAARVLRDNGFAVDVLDRGKRVGGRAGTRIHQGEQFDHGAQCFDVGDARFEAMVRSWHGDGVVAPWRAQIGHVGADGAVSHREVEHQRWTAVPGMAALAQHLAKDLAIRVGCHVDALAAEEGGVRLHVGEQAPGAYYDAVILALPPLQATRVLPPGHALRGALADVVAQTCWCAMLTLPAPTALRLDAATFDDEALAWAARESSKPGRRAGERWVLHARPAWSAARYDSAPDDAAHELAAAFAKYAAPDSSLEPTFLSGHRWGLARHATSQGPADCLWDGHSAVAVCGDWRGTSTIEAAWLSGCAAAGRVAGYLRDR